MSLAEEKLWERLRDHRAGYGFRRQHPMLTYFLDFYCPAAKLCVEVDGEQHDLEKDRERDFSLAEAGVLTVRFASLRVLAEMDSVVEEIIDLCRLRTRVPPRFRDC